MMFIRSIGGILVVGGLLALPLMGCDRLPGLSSTTGKVVAKSSTGRLSQAEKKLAQNLQGMTDPVKRIEEATNILITNKKPAMQLVAVQTLAQEKSGVVELQNLLKTSNSEIVRLNAAGALVRINTDDSRNAITTHFQSLNDEQEKARVLQAVAAFGTKESLPFLNDVIQNSSGELQALAKRARQQAEAR